MEDVEMGTADGQQPAPPQPTNDEMTSRDNLQGGTAGEEEYVQRQVGANVIEDEEAGEDGVAAQVHVQHVRAKYPDVHIRQPMEKDSYVYLGSPSAAALFDEVQSYREQNPTLDMNAALDNFMSVPDVERESLDAVIKAVYRSRRADYVLKYDDKCHSLEVRAAWERLVLRKEMVVVHESGIEVDEAFVLIFVPFGVLCDAAEDRELNFVIKHKEPLVPKPSLWQRFRNAFKLEDVVSPQPSANFQRGRLLQLLGSDLEHPVSGDDAYPLVVRHFFRPAQRNYLTYYLLARVVLSMTELKELKPADFPTKKRASIFALLHHKVYLHFFPLHDGSQKSHHGSTNARHKLKQHWAYAIFRRQPMDEIRDYFGERVALYFAFLGFYTVWLLWAAIAGIAVTAFGIVNAVQTNFSVDATGATRLFDNQLTLPFAAFMSLWATMYLEFWKRKNAYLAWWWDVMDYEERETERPEWYGTQIRVSPVTGKRELHYPTKTKLAKMTVSFACLGIAICIVLLSVTGAVVFRVWIRNIVGVCELDSGLYGVCTGSVYNLTGVAGCSDICWGQNSTTCANTTAVVWTTDGTLNDPFCQWDGNYCVPACGSYLTDIPCALARLGSQDGPLRSTCQFVDTYYISTITAALVNLFAIVVLNSVFAGAARQLNNWENHRTQTEWEDALIVKAFFFQFLNSYTSLFYIGFFKQATATNMFGNHELVDTCSYGSCFTELMIQLAIVFIGRQFIGHVQEILVPWFKIWLRRRKDAKEVAHMEKRFHENRQNNELITTYAKAVDPESDMTKPPQWFKDVELEPYGESLFGEYNEIALQFGFITLFVVAFPLGPFFAWFNNLIEIRVDSYKFVTKLQRPPALPAQDIGSWYSVLNGLSVFAVLTNAFLVAFSSAWLHDAIVNGLTVYDITSLSDLKLMVVAYQLATVLVFENVVFGLRILVAYLIPDVPGPVRMAIEREKYLQKLAFEGEDEDKLYSDEDLDAELADMTRKKRT